MKQIILILVLGLGLIALTACGLSRRSDSLTSAPSEPAVPSGSSVPSTPAAPAVLADGIYQVDTAASRVTWQAAKITATHTGSVSLRSGSLQVSGGALSGASFTIDMPTITSNENIDPLVKHLKSPDFFDVATYPEASLTVKSVRPGTAAGEYVLSGDLTVKSVTAPVEFTAQVMPTAKGLEARSSLSIDRTKWGIKYLSGNFFKDLGDKAIEDTIKFDIVLAATR